MTTETTESIDAQQLMAWDKQHVMGTYGRQPVAFVRGQGARLWDSEGKEYLDFLSGIAVCGVGHCHPHVVQCVQEQTAKLMHISNLFYNEKQPLLAKRLTEATGMDRAFFGNSGAEANECAIKIARKWAKANKEEPNCHEIITFLGSFHGRTITTVTATAQPKYQESFRPLPPGFKYIPVGDINVLDEAINEKTAAVMIEPIQGESGINVMPAEFLQAIRALCDESNVLFIADEVQTGIGRTGNFLACQTAGVQPDIVTLAKGVANGVPMGVCLARGTAATTLVPGDHGSTFGGQPLACASALAVLDVLEQERLFENARKVGAAFQKGLKALAAEFPDKVKEARGVGLMVALELKVPEARNCLKALLERGIVVNATSDVTLRFLPPLIVTEADCAQVVSAIRAFVAGL